MMKSLATAFLALYSGSAEPPAPRKSWRGWGLDACFLKVEKLDILDGCLMGWQTWFDGAYPSQTCEERARWHRSQVYHQCLKRLNNPAYGYDFLNIKAVRADAYEIVHGGSLPLKRVAAGGCHKLSAEECCNHFDGRSRWKGQDCVLVGNVQRPARDIPLPCQPLKWANNEDPWSDFVGDILDYCRAETEAPTPSPTALPTAAPTPNPTALPTAAPTPSPTALPTAAPTPSPTALPTAAPTPTPTAAPSSAPTSNPTASPTQSPSAGVPDMVCDYERMPLAAADLNKSFRIALAVTTDEAWVQASGGGGGLFGWRDNANGGHLTLYARQSSGWAGFGQDPEGGFHYAIHASDTAGNVITTGSFGQPAFWVFYMEMGRTYYMVIEWDEDASRFTWTVDGQVVVDRDAKLGFGSHAQGNLCFGTGGGATGWKGEIQYFSGEGGDILGEGPVYRWNREHSIDEYVECESRFVPLQGADLNKSFRIAHKVTTDEGWTQTGGGGGGIFGWRAQAGHLTLYARGTTQGFHYGLHASDVQGNVITTGSYGQPTFYVFYAARGRTYEMVVEWDEETGKLTWIVDGSVVLDREAPQGFGYHARGSLCYGTGGGAEAWIGTLEPIGDLEGSCAVNAAHPEMGGEVKANGAEWCGRRGNLVRCIDGSITVLSRGTCHPTEQPNLEGSCTVNPLHPKIGGQVKANGAEWCGRRGNVVQCVDGRITVVSRGTCDPMEPYDQDDILELEPDMLVAPAL